MVKKDGDFSKPSVNLTHITKIENFIKRDFSVTFFSLI